MAVQETRVTAPSFGERAANGSDVAPQGSHRLRADNKAPQHLHLDGGAAANEFVAGCLLFTVLPSSAKVQYAARQHGLTARLDPDPHNAGQCG